MRCGAELRAKPNQPGSQSLGPGRLVTRAQRRDQEAAPERQKQERQGFAATIIESLGFLWDWVPWVVSVLYVLIIPEQMKTDAMVAEHGELMRYSAQATSSDLMSGVLVVACVILLAWIIMDVSYNRSPKWWIVSFLFPPLAVVYLYKGRG